MRAELLDVLLCPRCGADGLRLTGAQLERVPYAAGAVEEVREGVVRCACGLELPIQDHVLSYDALMPDGVKADGRYWGQFYRFALGHGMKGHFDLKEGFPPLLRQGVFETVPQAPGERQGPHSFMADHPLIRDRRTVVDIGCGAGWSSLYLARRGFQVVAFDPSLEVMRLAKRYAIEAGVFVDYVCAGLGFIRFRDEVFDVAYALHSLHHIPDLGARMAEVHRLLKVGGCLAVDDHHQKNDYTDQLAAALARWVDGAVVPKCQVADPATMAGFPPGSSVHEDVSLGQTLAQAQRFFHIRYLDTRYTFLDMLSTVYWLYHGKAAGAFEHGSELVGLLYQAWRDAYPDGAEYVTFIGQKAAELPRFTLEPSPDVSQPLGQVPVGELVAGASLRQPFRPRRDHLCAVEVQLATFGRLNTGEVVFRLEDAQSGHALVTARFDAADVVNNAFRRFEFEPIAGSRGRRYVLVLEAPDGQPGDAITAWASAGPAPACGPWSLGPAAGGGTLAFRTFCARPVSEIQSLQRTTLQRAAYLYWHGGWPELWSRVRARLARTLRR
jgi:2-polyprenyl-3-methyl-5-hydroxy-6-metoxy-1,4-benzoquinol methylase